MNNNQPESSNYERIATAIEFIAENVNDQPSLEDVAAQLCLSPFHFQRLFSQWAGITPKRFLQALTLERSKQLLDQSVSLLETSDAVGLTSASRLYDHFVTLESVTPGEYKSGGADLTLQYGSAETSFGPCFIACSERGICKLSFVDNNSITSALEELSKDWHQAELIENNELAAITLSQLFGGSSTLDKPLSLHVRGTNFQINVWKSLLNIPYGRLVSYSHLAKQIGKPKAARAVGTAVGSNPVGFLIPCHRVIQQSGQLGGYRWGLTRKQAMLALETSQLLQES